MNGAEPDAGDVEVLRALLHDNLDRCCTEPGAQCPYDADETRRVADAILTSVWLDAVRRRAGDEAHHEVALWATRRKAFMEASRERETSVDRNRVPTLSSEFWRGHESALDDLIRTVTSDEPTDPETARRGGKNLRMIDWFNEVCPVGSPVWFWPGVREGEPRESVTRSEAWLLGGHTPVVMVEGYAGGIALSHVMGRVVPPAAGGDS